MRLSDRLGGHLVSGHVDAHGQVEQRRNAGDFTLFTFSLDPGLTKYVIEKGSITINGVSLTVNSCERDRFSVSIIPHTLAVTTLGALKQGDRVNIEVDMIGKYVEKLLAESRLVAGCRAGSIRLFSPSMVFCKSPGLPAANRKGY